MLRQVVIGVLTMGISVLGLPVFSNGQIVVEMGGNPACTKTSSSPHDQVTLTNATCVVSGVTVTITDSGGGTARVERQTNPTDTYIDQLRLTNAKITTDGPIQDFLITFRRTHATGPANTLTYFKTLAKTNISIFQGGGSGHNSLTMTGYVANPTTDAYLQMGLQKVHTMSCAPSCSESVNLETVGEWPASPNPPYHLLTPDNRNLKVNLYLTLLNAGDYVDISSQQVKINSQAKADEGVEIGTGFGKVGDIPRMSSQCWIVTCFSEATSRWFSPEPIERTKAAKLDEFAHWNWDNLSQDMAQGAGEYLASLATLLEIPVNRHRDFFHLAQRTFHSWDSQKPLVPEEIIPRLEQAMASSYLTAGLP